MRKTMAAIIAACVCSAVGIVRADNKQIEESSGAERHGEHSWNKQSKTAMSDQEFIREAVKGNQAEVQEAKLAQQKAQDQQIKEFARKIEEDHQQALDKLKTIAQSQNVQLQETASSKEEACYQKLSELSGQEFDRAFLRHQAEHHPEVIQMFERQAIYGKGEIKNYAAETLPTLWEHLTKASNLSIRTAGASISEPAGAERPQNSDQQDKSLQGREGQDEKRVEPQKDDSQQSPDETRTKTKDK
jgi:putative membrane protein